MDMTLKNRNSEKFCRIGEIFVLLPHYDKSLVELALPLRLCFSEVNLDDWCQYCGTNDSNEKSCLRILKCLKSLQVSGAFIIECLRVKSNVVEDTLILRLQVWATKQCNSSHIKNTKDHLFLLSHFQISLMEEVVISEKTIACAKLSPCHVFGCKVHLPDDLSVKLDEFHLPNVFKNLKTPIIHIPLASNEASPIAFYVMHLPSFIIKAITTCLKPLSFSKFALTCKMAYSFSFEIAPYLRLQLYQHQRETLMWMTQREAPNSNQLLHLPHPYCVPSRNTNEKPFHIDCISGEVFRTKTPRSCGIRGGMFCDEPGLGKTITMLALILRTKGAHSSTVNKDISDEDYSYSLNLRGGSSRRREVDKSQLLRSKSTLIIVPDTLVTHWEQQIRLHTHFKQLEIYFDKLSTYSKPLPLAEELAKYDIVITTLGRLGTEWFRGRPDCALEQRRPSRLGFEDPENNRYACGAPRGATSVLLQVHWVRVIVDEGHKLGGLGITHQSQMAHCLVADKRWVMTGTPTPNTLNSADIRHLFALLIFLKQLPYGGKDGKVWSKAISRDFERRKIEGLIRLKSLLEEIMIRHSKADIKQIPPPIRHCVTVQPTLVEYTAYNAVVAAVKANLVITNMDPYMPGAKHKDSLLNPSNRKYAMEAVSNLRLACCGGGMMSILLAPKDYNETIVLLSRHGAAADQIESIAAYMRRAQQRGETTRCLSCSRDLQLLMLTPCCHLCCSDCIQELNETCGVCHQHFDAEDFQLLQPGFYYNWANDSATIESLQALQKHETLLSSLNTIENVHSSKAAYLVKRFKELEEDNLRKTTNWKVIVFSQFREHIVRLGIALEANKIGYACFFGGFNGKLRNQELVKFQNDSTVKALLMSDLGAHGLDLSFVTHIFLMDEIWDHSLEDQVISRAYRMRAKTSVIVEQLVMEGTVEVIMQQIASRENTNNQKDSINIGKRSRVENISSNITKRSETSSKAAAVQRRLHFILENLCFLKEHKKSKRTVNDNKNIKLDLNTNNDFNTEEQMSSILITRTNMTQQIQQRTVVFEN